ncbi:MAG: hypothetical protein AAFX80_01670 [Cyanobacteria bacterium J06639_18]
MKVKVQKPIIVDAEFREKTGDIPSFQEQIEERISEVGDEVIEGGMLLILLGISILIAVVLFHPLTQEKIRSNYPTIIYHCKSD